MQEWESNGHMPGSNHLGEITTVSGMVVTPLALKANTVRIGDIAHSLARLCRFNGHVQGFMSVAQHSVEVSYRPINPDDLAFLEELGIEWNDETEQKLRRTLLLHDASEAYMGDMPSPIKHLPAMEHFRESEEVAHWAIATALDCFYPHPPVVHRLDREQLQFEIHFKRNVECGMLPDEAATAFLKRYYELSGELNLVDA